MIQYSGTIVFSVFALISVGISAHTFRGFPPEYICEREGFFVSPEDCRDFFRCYLQPKNYGNNSDYRPDVGNRPIPRINERIKDERVYQLAKFRCGTGTIFDEASSTCNFPERVDPNQKCVRKPEPDYAPPPRPETPNDDPIYHSCYRNNGASEVICIKDQGNNENIFAYNSNERQSISFVVREIVYLCGYPREVFSREYIGEFTAQPKVFLNFVSRAVSNGKCRKTVFYDCKIAGVPSKCNRPPFEIDFTLEERVPGF